MLGPMRCTLAAVMLGVLTLVGCSGVRSLSDSSDAAGPELGESEQAVVRGQIEAALRESRFADAWNQEVELGSAQERMEAIALAALEDESGDAEDMFGELRAKWGGLSEGARQRVEDVVRERMTAGRWELAAEQAITAADDPQALSHAFRVYEQTPARKAAAVLKVIQDARKEAAEK